MEWSDTGYVLQAKKYGESSALVSILTPNHGRQMGLLKGAFSKSKRGMIEPGCHVNAKWSARLSGQLGQWQLEQLSNTVAHFFDNREALICLRAMCDLCHRALPEAEKHEVLYSELQHFLNARAAEFGRSYVFFEITLLRELGFRLVLDQCAATGQKDDLVYISPKSGQSVSKNAGKPYENKLFPLPEFLKNVHLMPDISSIVQALTVTGYFLNKHVWPDEKGWHAIPESRNHLVHYYTRLKQAAQCTQGKDAA